jgi:hypothetical protein
VVLAVLTLRFLAVQSTGKIRLAAGSQPNPKELETNPPLSVSHRLTRTGEKEIIHGHAVVGYRLAL